MNHKKLIGLLFSLVVMLASNHVAAGQTGMGSTLDKVEIESVARLDTVAAGTGALVAGFMLFQNLQKEGVQWQPYDAEIIEQTDKPVMLDFYADWCIPCIELDRKTFTDGRVIDQTESFVRMKVDLTHFDSKRAEQLRRQYEVAGVPTIMFLDSEGNEVEEARIVGFLNADNFLKRANEISQK